MHSVLAWHFVRKGGLTRDGRRVTVGDKMHVDPPIELCERGLHASRRLIDALKFAPGPVLCRVRCSGIVIHDGDELICSDREVLAMADVSLQLREFACNEAERALHRVGMVDERPWRLIEATRGWLQGYVTDEDLGRARVAARNNAWNAAQRAAWYAAQNAAWSVAWHAARNAAWEAARAATAKSGWSAAMLDGSWSIVRAEQNARLESLLALALGLEPQSADP